MMKQRLNLFTISIACLCLVGCSAVPKARITHIDSFTVSRTLHENGTHRTKSKDDAFLTPIFDDLFDTLLGKFITAPKTDPNTLVDHITVWPDPEVIHNKRKTTVKYYLPRGFEKIECKDTIKLDVRQSTETIVSVKCQTKHVDFIAGVILQWFTPYKRDHGREQMLMINTTEQLKAAHQAQIEWLGKWRPDPNSL